MLHCQHITHLPPHLNLQDINVSGTFISKIAGHYPALLWLTAKRCPRLTHIDLQSSLGDGS